MVHGYVSFTMARINPIRAVNMWDNILSENY